MSQEYKLKDISSLASVSPYEKREVEVEGIEDGKVLLLNHDGQVHALSPRCTHYGAPLKNGVVTPDGRLTCPWHGACFKISSGDVEDAPALNALNKFDVFEKNGAVYIRATENDIKSGQRDPVLKCAASKAEEKVVVIGGGSGTISTVQTLRELKYPGSITIISTESDYVIDRTKLSKALIPDASKILWRPKEWYEQASIDKVVDEVTSVDFKNKSVSTKSGTKFPYTKLVLATGGIPRNLPLPGFKELGNIFTLRTVEDVQKILGALGDSKRKVVVIGSSFIGMEVGNALRSKEHDVTIVGMENAPMERVMGADVGRIFQRNLEKNGVVFKLSASVEKATPSDDGKTVGAVHLKDGSVLQADVVVLGVGVRPATDFLGDAIKLEKDGSVATDSHFLIPESEDVFAIGDIATFPYNGPGGNGAPVRIEHWNVAQNSGRAVAKAIVHAQRAPVRSASVKQFIPIFWSALGAQLRYCGNTVNGFDDVVLRQPEETKFTAFYTKGETVVAVATMGMDPVMSKCAELMRGGKMVSKKEVKDGVDVLQVGV
ncbi:Pyridine nucleotide-disulfide oxidoreductase dimerization [Penicillium cinerascens]|uniref:Pyridine nucleotide-disulfide oxidoreductase dimerization n=1 Tax=Penicillium cinerascens TaxID=70096 RepID=A0A9W9SWZ1_9EURO|nr:Pyridine nucleotide-disulfide oxidoreductase dimerization [Penicillium cinerascens]KAJ5201528.1 Pyridine nucleotide-disulfide oxidoreductase dimerization [Penicillium cinerascens]